MTTVPTDLFSSEKTGRTFEQTMWVVREIRAVGMIRVKGPYLHDQSKGTPEMEGREAIHMQGFRYLSDE